MVKSREEAVKWLSLYFKNYYDINELDAFSETVPVLRCDLHVSNQKFFLFKKNVIWEANCHEYAYIFSVSKLTPDVYKAIEKYVHEEGMKLINPGPMHMKTILSAFIFCDKYDTAAVSLLKRCHIRKDFKLSFHGWMELHTALYSGSDGYVATNHAGREYKKLLKKINKKSK